MDKRTSLGNPAVEPARRSVRVVLDAALSLLTVAAIASLVLLYGWRGRVPWPHGPILVLAPQQFLIIVQVAIAILVAADRLLRLGLARSPRAYALFHWVDYAMIVLAVAAVVAARAHNSALEPGNLWVVLTQIYIAFALLPRVIAMHLRWLARSLHPIALLLLTFIVLCLGGAALLMLPAAGASNSARLWAHDALFTATSAACVTGLTVRDTGTEFSVFGQSVILALIQVGGLTVMLFGSALASAFARGLAARHNNTLSVELPQQTFSSLGRLATFVIAATLLLELLGAALMYPMFLHSPDANGRPLGPVGAAWYAAFHSVSAFCNGGFALYRDNLRSLQGHWALLGVMAPLIVLGGLGMPVLQELAAAIRALAGRIARGMRQREPIRPWSMFKLSLHSKVVLWTTLLLLFFGTTTLLLVETIGMNIQSAEPGKMHGDATIRGEFERFTPSERLEACAFLSVSSRTGGFRTFDLSQMSDAGKVVTCILMAIGGSPGSAAGGIKTVTFAILVMIVVANLRLRDQVEMFRRTVSHELVHKCITMLVLFALLVTAVSLTLAILERSHGRFVDLFFESVSACSTAGLSTGVTPNLTDLGKMDLVLGMFLGRVGPLMLVLALVSRLKHVSYTYPREHVVLG